MSSAICASAFDKSAGLNVNSFTPSNDNVPPPWAASVTIDIVEKSAPPTGGVYVKTPVVLSYGQSSQT